MAEENIASTKKEEKQEYVPGPRGEVGDATAGLTIKQRWHEANFKLVDAEDPSNPHKRVWEKLPTAISLKRFARQLAAKGDPNAKDWFAHKKGSLNKERSDANIKAANEAAAATKLSKRKKGQGKGGNAPSTPTKK